MKSIFKICAVLFVFVSLTSCKSYINPVAGNTSLGFLAGQEKVNVVFNYDDLSVNEYGEEKDYIEASMSKRDEEEPGTGAEWKKKWFGQRDAVFEPEFVEALNDENEKGIYFSRDNTDAEYTLYLEVKYIKTGWNAGIARKDAKVDITAKFVQTSSIDNGVDNSEALFTINEVPGYGDMGYDFSVSQRVGASFEHAGEELGKYIANQDF